MPKRRKWTNLLNRPVKATSFGVERKLCCENDVSVRNFRNPGITNGWPHKHINTNNFSIVMTKRQCFLQIVAVRPEKFERAGFELSTVSNLIGDIVSKWDGKRMRNLLHASLQQRDDVNILRIWLQRLAAYRRLHSHLACSTRDAKGLIMFFWLCGSANRGGLATYCI